MLRAAGVVFVKVLSAARVSPALLNLLRRAVVERKRARRSEVPRGIGLLPPITAPTLRQAEGRRDGWLGRFFRALREASITAIGPRTTAREHFESHGRTSRLQRPATRVPRGLGDIRGRSSRGSPSRNCRPATAKRAAHAHSQVSGPVRTCRLPRDGIKVHVI